MERPPLDRSLFSRPALSTCGDTSKVAQVSKRRSDLTLSLVVATRNDNLGNDLIQRASLVLPHMLATVDEVVLVDFNTLPPLPQLRYVLPATLTSHSRLRHIVVDPQKCQVLRGAPCGPDYFDALARIVGIYSAASDVIASTNIDDVPPPRFVLNTLLDAMPTWRDAYTLVRHEVSYEEALKWRVGRPHHANVSSVRPHCTSASLESIHDMHRALGPLAEWGLFADVSVIYNCGDFQMAHRELWQRATFSRSMEKRYYTDTLLQAAWMSLGATVHVPDGMWVTHIAHGYREAGQAAGSLGSSMNSGKFEQLLKRGEVNTLPLLRIRGGIRERRDQLELVSENTQLVWDLAHFFTHMLSPQREHRRNQDNRNGHRHDRDVSPDYAARPPVGMADDRRHHGISDRSHRGMSYWWGRLARALAW